MTGAEPADVPQDVFAGQKFACRAAADGGAELPDTTQRVCTEPPPPPERAVHAGVKDAPNLVRGAGGKTVKGAPLQSLVFQTLAVT